MFGSDIRTVHFVGICGTAMASTAAALKDRGFVVTGSDQNVYPPMSTFLASRGIEVMNGYTERNLAHRPDLVVIGNAISRGNLEAEHVLEHKLRYCSLPELLKEFFIRGKRSIVVAGTHGKTTTTSLLTWVFEHNGLNPSYLIGGIPTNLNQGARFTDSEWFIIEGDEYDTAFFDKRSKFVHYRPRTAVLNNLEFDHADIFDNLAAIERQFHHLVRTVPASGCIVANGLEESIARVLHMGCWSPVQTFGSAVSDYTARGEPHDFTVLHRGQPVGQVQWALTGTHNQLNALAAIAAAAHVGVDPAVAAEALHRFANARRRMEVRGVIERTGGAVTVYDDFAHHPTAIRTTVDGLRRRLDAENRESERILAIFEPRSNTMKLGAMKSQLPWSLENADLAFCHSGGLDWDATAALGEMGVRAQVASDIATLARQVIAAVRPGDHLLCMSNGSFGGIHALLMQQLGDRSA